jgi:lysophospholipase L1-like esterase
MSDLFAIPQRMPASQALCPLQQLFERLKRLAWISFVGLLVLSTAHPANAQTVQNRLILIGDSTMAPENGYGNALCQRLLQTDCWNLAKNGRSSKSFREEGLWAHALNQLQNSAPVSGQWMLIQFGHNDQPGKPGRSTKLETEYPANLERYVIEARQAGLTPILVTPLIRRSFKDGQHIDDLAPWAQSMKNVADKLQVPVIDLHASSRQKVREVGSSQADRYAVSPPGTPAFDRTHLGPLGACVFAAQVGEQLSRITQERLQTPSLPACEG